MVYKLNNWTLYKRDVKLRMGNIITIYFFCEKVPQRGTACDLPENYSVGINKRTGLPYVKKR